MVTLELSQTFFDLSHHLLIFLQLSFLLIYLSLGSFGKEFFILQHTVGTGDLFLEFG